MDTPVIDRPTTAGEFHYLVGKKVRVPKGTRIMNDMSPSPKATVQRTITVTVDHLVPGETPLVRWSGSGGYWRGVAASEVELLY